MSEIAPRETGRLETGDGHALYWEACGNPNGAPAVFLHGGPGSGCAPWQRGLFDQEKYNVILFDQRGSGRSAPHASLENNTTAHLVADLELLRKKFGFEKWTVVGGSWGSTLALAYADKHPDRISALVLWGIFLIRDIELRDLYFEGGVASRVFTDVFAPYIELLPAGKRGDPIRGYKELFESKDEATRLKALDLWTRLESRVVRLVVPDEELKKGMSNPGYVLAHSLIENHYFLSKGFIDGDALLETIGEKIKNVPLHIVQGRYDMVTPFATAWDLHKAVKHSTLHVVGDAGHSGREPGIQKKLIEILNAL